MTLNIIVTLKCGLQVTLRSLKVVSFESLGAVLAFYSRTMGVSIAVCEIFSVKELCELENMVRVRSRSLEMAPFDRSHMSSY